MDLTIGMTMLRRCGRCSGSGCRVVSTPHLIDALCASLQPVRRLRPPLLRAALWLLLAAAVVALLAIFHGTRTDLALLQAPAFTAALAGRF